MSLNPETLLPDPAFSVLLRMSSADPLRAVPEDEEGDDEDADDEEEGDDDEEEEGDEEDQEEDEDE